MKRPELLAAIILVLLSAPVQAHHVLGLPHYSYLKEYPQVPRLDLETQVGPYFAVFTVMPGNPKPGETFRIHVYVKDGRTGKPFDDGMDFVIREKSFWGEGREVFRFHQPDTDDHQFKQTARISDPGEYQVTVTFRGPHDTTAHSVSFPLEVGQPSLLDRLVPFLLAGGLLLLLIAGQRWWVRHRRDTVNGAGDAQT